MENSKPEEIRETALTVRFNHRDLPLDEETAKKYAQIGLKFENTLSSLALPASINGVGVSEYVSELEAEAIESLKEKYPDISETELCDLTKVYKQRVGVLNEKKDDFSELFPNVDDSTLPREVTDLSVERGISVTDAYLRYLYKKGQVCQNYAENAIKHYDTTIGSMKTADHSQNSGAVSAMLKGLQK